MVDPIEYMKKIGLFGIGIYALTEEKINESIKEMVESGDINREEGKKFVEDLIEKRRVQQDELEKNISSNVKETLDKSDLATKDAIKSLEEKVESLEKLLEEATKKV